jgi:hypothetical protein
MSWKRPNIGSRVNREVHARFWERPGVRFLRATRQILTPRSAPACLLPPNADIAMFAGRAALRGEQARPAWRCPPRRKGERPRAVGRCWSTGHLPTGPVPRGRLTTPRHYASYAPASGGARTLRLLHDPDLQHRLRRRRGRTLHVLAFGDGGGDQGLLDVGELLDLALELGDALLTRSLR